MRERWMNELNLVKLVHGDIELAPNMSWFKILRWKLPQGWNKTETALIIDIPVGYPVTAPDNFYVDLDLRLSNGTQPGNTSVESQGGQQRLRFSYHIEGGDWRPHSDNAKGHNLLTFIQGISTRLGEVS